MGCCTSWTSLCPCDYRKIDDKDERTTIGRSTFVSPSRKRMEGRNGVDEIAEDVLGTDSQLNHPIQERIENPKSPYIGAIPYYLEPGRMILLHGVVKCSASRLALNLCCGSTANDDIAFHINPRLDHKYVVRNSRIAGRWGPEEDAVPQRFPFKRGEKFFMVIFVTEEQFMVAVNGRHFCSYQYRLPLQRINTIEVFGDMNIELIEHLKSSIYPEPCPMRTELFQHITELKHSVDEETQFVEPPYIGLLPQEFNVGKELQLVGRVKLLPHSFYVNLQQGQQNWPHPLILLHITPHFLVTSDTVTQVVYNSWLDGQWGEEEYTKVTPFHPGTPFVLNIRCDQDCYSISVNGRHTANFKHRSLPELVDTIVIEGDVLIKDLQLI